MESKKTGEEETWERDHSPLPPHAYHHCKECQRFFPEFVDFGGLIQNYCDAKMKQISSKDNACSSFALVFIITGKKQENKKIQKIGTVESELSRRMMHEKPPLKPKPPLKATLPPVKFLPKNIPPLKPGDKPREITKSYANEVAVIHDKPKRKESKNK